MSYQHREPRERVRCGDTITGRVEVISARTDKPITELPPSPVTTEPSSWGA